MNGCGMGKRMGERKGEGMGNKGLTRGWVRDEGKICDTIPLCTSPTASSMYVSISTACSPNISPNAGSFANEITFSSERMHSLINENSTIPYSHKDISSPILFGKY